MIRKYWNMIRWGSPTGPSITIDWDNREITCHNMSNRLSTRITVWVLRGQVKP